MRDSNVAEFLRRSRRSPVQLRGDTVKKKVVLFYPPYDGPPLSAPLCLLALASPLLQAGFEVKLVDNLTSPDFENVILREIEDALCLGMSVLTGPMIGSAVRIAKKVKRAPARLASHFRRVASQPGS